MKKVRVVPNVSQVNYSLALKNLKKVRLKKMITNSYTIQKREREPESEKTLFDILAYAEKFVSEKNCKCDIQITRNEKVLKIEDFNSLENLSDDIALQVFKMSSLKVNVLSKYVYQNYPVLDNNPEDDKKPSFIVELLRLDIIL